MLRAAQESDLAQIVEIENVSFKPPWSGKALADALNDPCVSFKVSESGGAVAGYIIYSLIDGDAEIFSVATAPENRKAGIGTLLVREMQSEASTAFLEVRKSNAAALALYEKCGFATVGERKRYYSDGEDALIMMWNR